jgi:hypothetical protein
MRDIVSEVGTFYSGVTALTTYTSTQTSPAAALTGYDGALVYILCSSVTSTATMTSVVQVTNDNGAGSPVAGNWTAAPVADLVLWTATSTSNFNPVKAGNLQPQVLTATNIVNQRVGYIGNWFTASGGDGLLHSADWIRVVSTYGGSGNVLMDVVILLGRPRLMPSAV